MKLISLFGLLAVSALAQTQAFEVASVRPATSGVNGVRGGCHGIDSHFEPNETVPPLGRCVITDGRLSHMIGIAYGVKGMSLIKGGPDWVMMGDARFTVQAKAEHPETATEAELLTMLQHLLEERFQLKYHLDEKMLSGFALTVAKNGPKLKTSTSDEAGLAFGPSGKPRPGEPTILTAKKQSTATLARILSQIGPGPVTDETGLEGVYDFTLAWDFEDFSAAAKSDVGVPATAGQSLFTAIQQQLGLRLEPRKVPVSYFVIESAQKPKEN